MAFLGILTGESLAEAARCPRDENPLFFSWHIVYIHTLSQFCRVCGFQGHVSLFVQGQRRSLEIGQHGRPTFFTESFDCRTLGGLPSRREFLHLFSAFRRNCQFHKPAAPTTADLYQTVSLQWAEISHERRALHPKPITPFRHGPTVLGYQ